MTAAEYVPGADDVDQVVADCAEVLEGLTERDWSVNAGRLEWSCLETAEHITGDLVAYAAQLVGRARDHYLPFEALADEGTPPAGLVRSLRAAGGLLSAVVRTTPPEARGWHPAGAADASGFAAMGLVETLLHTHDITAGLQVPWTAPEGPAAAVLGRLFPHVHPDGSAGAWRSLLWATGRGNLSGRDPVTSWRWYSDLSEHAAVTSAFHATHASAATTATTAAAVGD